MRRKLAPKGFRDSLCQRVEDNAFHLRVLSERWIGPERFRGRCQNQPPKAQDSTFWYVNEYVPTTSPVGWRLRIGSFRLARVAQSAFSRKVHGGPVPSMFLCHSLATWEWNVVAAEPQTIIR
jgi:hypothetical protein